MLRTGLEFATGTTDDCKRLVTKLFGPEEILGAYREGRRSFKTGDLVLVTQEENPSGFEVMPRVAYIARLREGAPKILPVLAIAHKSAHQIVSLPFEAEAIWLVILRRGQPSVDVVIFTTPYEVATENEELSVPNN